MGQSMKPVELRPRPVEMAATAVGDWEAQPPPWPAHGLFWGGHDGNPAPHTHGARVARLTDGTGRVTITDDDDGGLQWGHPAPSDAELREVARWLSGLPVWVVQAIDARLCALGWAREVY